MRICAIAGCNKPASKRGICCGPDHAQQLRNHGKSTESANTKIQEKVTIEEEYRLKTEVKRLKSELNDAAQRLSEKLALSSFFDKVLNSPTTESPSWVVKRSNSEKQALPTAFLSDTHFDEVVRPEEVEWMNGYNREIGQTRLQNFFENTVKLAKEFLSGVSYPGIILPIGGDIFSGDIHEELVRTNESTLIQSLLYWIDPMVSGIKLLADEFGLVTIPCVVGNHPRNSKKPIAKLRIPNNFDWMFYCLLKKIIDGDSKYSSRIDFRISRGADIEFSAYGTKFLLTHGDQFRGGSGISGLLSPLMIGDARKRKRATRINQPYDYMVFGHWHQRVRFKGLIGNGSIKGMDEYGYTSNFDFEPPEQTFWLTDPIHGVTIDAPIHVYGDREPWMQFSTVPAVVNR